MKRLKPKYIRYLSLLAAVIFALPLFENQAAGFYLWLSPFLMLNSLFVLKSLVWLNIFGWLILFISFFRNRWFCRYMCPVGAGCDAFSKWGKKRSRWVRKLPLIGRWLALISLAAAFFGIPLFIYFDPLAIFHGFFTVFTEDVSLIVILSMLGLLLLFILHLFLPGVWCTKICPLGGLFDELTSLRKKGKNLFHPKTRSAKSSAFSRRSFMVAGTGIAAGILLPKILTSKPNTFFRPPASTPNNIFNTLCIRCGNCIKTCPTKIITHHTGTAQIAAWMTPEVTFEKQGYCLEKCNLCGTVCPSGSISPFTVEAKKQLFIAGIRIGLEDCLLTHLKECDRCKSACGYEAIQIVQSANSLAMKPVGDNSKCVGCGACAAICPADSIFMVPLQKSPPPEFTRS